jgi:acetyl/propionyl-CoA carboxylase alpha subunit
MIEVGVPCVPGSVTLESYEQAEKLAEEFGYPVMLKATAGGWERYARRLETRRNTKSRGKCTSRIGCSFEMIECI